MTSKKSTPESKQLYKIQSEMYDAWKLIEDKNKILVDFENNDAYAFPVVRWYYKPLVLLIHIITMSIFVVSWAGDSAWWVWALALLFCFVLTEKIILLPMIKGKISRQIALAENSLNQNEEKLSEIIEETLMPEAHALGMFTAKELKQKTVASLLDIDFIQHIIDDQLEDEQIEQIDLIGGEVVYKSLINDGGTNTETIHLELDDD